MRSDWLGASLAVLAGLAAQSLAAVLAPPVRFLKYPAAAELLASGELDAERVIDFSPAYLWLHRVALALLGDSQGAARAISLVQVALVALATGLLWLFVLRVLRRLEIGSQLPARVLAIGLFCLNPALLVYGSVLEPEALLLFLICALLLVAESWLDSASQSVDRSRTAWLAVLAGVVSAACLLTRPTLAVAVVLVPLAWWLARRSGQAGRASRQLLVSVLLFLLPVAVALAGLSMRNYRAVGSLSPSVMNPGTVFFEGNNPVSWGSSAIYPPMHYELEATSRPDQPDSGHDHYRTLARASTGRALSVSEVNRFWSRKAWAFILDHPLRWLHTEWAKLDALLRATEEHDLAAADARRLVLKTHWLSGVPLPFLAFSALYGVVVFGWRARELLVPYGLLVAQVASMMLFYVSSRQRLTALPLLVVFAVLAWSRLRGQGRRGLLLGCLLVVAALAYLPPTERQKDRRHHSAQQRSAAAMARSAQLARDRGDLREAAPAAARAAALSPLRLQRLRPWGLRYPAGYAEEALRSSPPIATSHALPASDALDRALLEFSAGRLPGARTRLVELANRGAVYYRGSVGSSEVEYYRALVEVATGDTESAVKRLEELLLASPGEPFALAELAVLTGDDTYAATLRRYFEDGSASFLLGQAARRSGNLERARKELQTTLRLLPQARTAWVELAATWSESADPRELEQGREAYARAMKLGNEPMLLESEIVRLFEQRLEEAPPDRQTLLRRASVLRQFGHYDEALETLRGAAAVLGAPDASAGQDLEVESAAEIEWLERALAQTS